MPLTSTPTLKFSSKEMREVAKRNSPNLFIGDDRYNQALTSEFRSHMQANEPNTFGTKPFSAVNPLALELKDFINGDNAKPKIKQKFIAEIDQYIHANKVNPLWLFIIHFRYAKATSSISFDEMTLFENLAKPEFIRGFDKFDVWQDHFNSFDQLSIANDHLQQYHDVYNIDIDYKSTQLIDELLKKVFPLPVYYPFAGMGKFGITFLLERVLQGVYPIAIPLKTDTGAHGVKLSRFGFALHDAFHADVDPRYGALMQHILNATAKFVTNGGAANEFIPWYTLHAVVSYFRLMMSLSRAHDLFLAVLLPHFGKREYQKAMAGFFIMMHEYPSYYPGVFTSTNFKGVINSTVNGAKLALRSSNAWESSIDPLMTSPIDGKSELTDEQIYEIAVLSAVDSVNYNAESYNKYPIDLDNLSGKDKNKRARFEFAKADCTIKRTAGFIDITFIMRNGGKLTQSNATLLHKWRNMQDSVSLLKFAGVKFQVPELNGLTISDNRRIAQATLDKVRAQLIGLLDDFKAKASYVADLNIGDNFTLSEAHFYSQFHHNQQVEKAVQQTLNKPRPKFRML